MTRRVAILCFALLALIELGEAMALLSIRADQATVAEVGAWFGLDPETEHERLNILIPITLGLSVVGALGAYGVYRRAAGADRWRRTAFVAFGLYSLWALTQLWLLADATPPGRAWLATVGLAVGLLATVGYVAAGRVTTEEEYVFSVEEPGVPVEAAASGLRYQDVEVGQGPLASPGRTAVVHYTGWLTDGKKFDSSHDRGQPFSFPVGAGRVIKGWDEGVATMRQGGRRRLIVPPELGYGAGGVGPIPGGATLVFDVELVDVR